MIRCSIENLQPGMVLGEPIFHDNGDIILQKGTKLTDALIKRLQSRDDISTFLKRIPETDALAVDILSPDDLSEGKTEKYFDTPKKGKVNQDRKSVV